MLWHSSTGPPDDSLEKKFRMFREAGMRWQSVRVCAGFAASSAAFAITEGLAGFSVGAVGGVAACRFASIAIALFSWTRICNSNSAGPRLEVLIVVSWAMQLVCAAAAAGVASTLAPPGLVSPFSPFQWWSSACSMIHAVLILASGLRFPLVAALAVVQAMLTAVGFVSSWSNPDLAVAVSFVLLVFGCASSAFAHEATSRAGFFGECFAGSCVPAFLVKTRSMVFVFMQR
jgi:hypothetical protein